MMNPILVAILSGLKGPLGSLLFRANLTLRSVVGLRLNYWEFAESSPSRFNTRGPSTVTVSASISRAMWNKQSELRVHCTAASFSNGSMWVLFLKLIVFASIIAGKSFAFFFQ